MGELRMLYRSDLVSNGERDVSSVAVATLDMMMLQTFCTSLGTLHG